MYYTSEGTFVKRNDICHQAQLPDFAKLDNQHAYGLRILPTGGLLVADSEDIARLNNQGKIIQTYDVPGEDNWFALNLDPDKKSFWSAGYDSKNVYKIDIESGKVLETFSSALDNNPMVDYTPTGLAIAGEITVAAEICDDGIDNNDNGLIDEGCNNLPIANAGLDQTVNENTKIVLNGTKSEDPDGNITSYLWKQVSGIHKVILSNSSSASPTFLSPIVDSAGDLLTFQLAVFDNEGANSTDTVNIRVEDTSIPEVNSVPVAMNSSLVTEVNTPLDIILNGNDKNHDALAFRIVTPPKSGRLSTLSIQTNFIAEINGTQEVPQNSDIVAKGIATFRYNSTSKILSYSVKYAGLQGVETAAHIHMGATEVDGPIQFMLPIGNDKSGTLGPLSQQQEISLLQSNVYVNIHSTTQPDGEIGGQILPTGNSSAFATYTPNLDFNGTDNFLYKISDGKNDSNIANVTINITISIKNVIDADRDQVTIKSTRILQDEPVNGLGDGDTSPDASGIATSIADLRAERSGTGDGRVYHIYFSADDGKENGMCNSEVLVSVPHDQAHKAVDSGPNYDSTMEVSDKSSSQADNMKVRTKEPVEQQEQQQHQKEPQVKPEKSQPRQGSYWLTHKADTEKLLPLSVSNLTINNFEKIVSVLNIGGNNHNLYDNLGAQILTTKLNIKNNTPSCNTVNDAIKYGNDVLQSVNHKGKGTVSHKLTDPQMKNIIKAHSILMQFNIQGCTAISPTDKIFTPNVFEILYSDLFSFFVN